MEEQALYQMALTRIPGIGPAYTKKLIARFGDAAAVFRAKKENFSTVGISKEIVEAILGFRGHAGLEDELRLLKKKGARPLFFTDSAYPRRLLRIPDSPPLLFYAGNADLNAKKIVAVVGTRSPSAYGRQVTSQLIRQLAQPDLLLISGLALGIDAAAHEAALNNHLPTVGILGHGFEHLYPAENGVLAKAMLRAGGLLTSFAYHAQPETYHFPFRNQIVAALCDAVLVIETGRKGGSLITVKKALEYNRKVFAVPGRLMDTRSAGCNWLIQQGLAGMLTSGDQLPAAMGWEWPAGGAGIQAALPLSSPGSPGKEPEERLLNLLKETDSLALDELTVRSRLSPSSVALHLLNLELQGLISALPGKRYKCNAPLVGV
jgi:DNA processing protein